MEENRAIMRVRPIKLLFVSALMALVLPSVAQETGDVRDVVTIDRLPENTVYHRIYQPFIAQWDEDYYVVSYGLQLRGKTDMADIMCSITRDGGKTWSPPSRIFDHRIPNGSRQYAYANPVLFIPEGQRIIWYFGMRCPISYSDSEDSELCAAYSCDGGVTWQQVELRMRFHSPVITNAGVVTVSDNGMTRYLLPVHRNTLRHDPKGDREQFLLESSNLLDWNLAGYIPRPADVWLHEGNIAEGDEPDELKIVMRTAKYSNVGTLEPPRAWSSVSKDNGKTWSMAEEEPALWNTASKGFFGKDSKGRHIYVYNDDARQVRRGLYYVVKEPGGKWSDPKLFYWNNDRNSYPTLIEKEPGVFLCVWDSSDDPDNKRTAIRFGILDLNK
ncbi:MAG: exo-alpha-sialidase [Bacteroidia bacterium]|nr:MAG: exo-alpha-sialidase [Bacteroidia bacterium]